MKAAQIFSGWIVVFSLLYFYVYKQLYLVNRMSVFIAVLAIGTLLSAVVAALEMSLASLSSDSLVKLNEENQTLESAKAGMGHEEYIEKKKRVIDTLNVYYKKDHLIPPLAILNNMFNTIMAAFLPLSYIATLTDAETAKSLTINFY